MASAWGKDESDDFGAPQEEGEEDLYKSVNDHLIFLIDGRANMFESNSKGEAINIHLCISVVIFMCRYILLMLSVWHLVL